MPDIDLELLKKVVEQINEDADDKDYTIAFMLIVTQRVLLECNSQKRTQRLHLKNE